MKTIKFLSYTIIVLLLNISIASCSGDDGAAGEDGNANVQTIRFQSPQWATNTSSFYKQMLLDVPQITQEDINFSAILHYISFQNQRYALLPVDSHFINGIGSDFSVRASPSNGSSTIRISKTSSVALPNPTPSVDFLKIVIIKPSDLTNTSGNSSGRPLSPKQRVFNELQNANVDINDYYAVCAYYGINP